MLLKTIFPVYPPPEQKFFFYSWRRELRLGLLIVFKNNRTNDRFLFRFFSKNDRFVFEKTRSFGKRTTRFENDRSLNEKRSFLIVFKESSP